MKRFLRIALILSIVSQPVAAIHVGAAVQLKGVDEPRLNINAGFKLNSNFGFELGHESSRHRAKTSLIPGTNKTSISIKGPYVGAVAFYPLVDTVSLLGSIGVTSVKKTACHKGNHLVMGRRRMVYQSFNIKENAGSRTALRFMVGAQYRDGGVGFRATASYVNIGKPKDFMVYRLGAFWEF